MHPAITDEHVRHFEEDGFFVLERAVQGDTLEMLRREADLAVLAEDERIENQAADIERITHGGHRYFVIQRSRTRHVLREFLWSPLMIDLCARLVGPDAYLFTELFVCKRSGVETSFGWHQDHGYVDHFGFGHYPPNLTVWTALDDMHDKNGTLRVLPFSRGGHRAVARHHPAPEGRDIIADFGGAPGELLEMPAGSVVVMSGLLPHASGPNTTDGTRRAHLVQYSGQPILIEGVTPAQLAVPVLVSGVRTEPDYSGQPPRTS